MTNLELDLPTITNTRLSGWRKWAARAVWLALVMGILGLQIAVVRPYLDYLQVVCTVPEDLCGEQLTAESVAALAAEGISPTGYAFALGGVAILSLFVWQGIGLLVFLLRSDDWMAMLVSLFLIVFSTASFSSGLMEYAAVAYPQLGPTIIALSLLGELLIAAFFLLFPNGRIIPRWLWWLLLAPPLLSATDLFPATTLPEAVYTPIFFSLIGLMLFAQVYRYRRVSTPVEKRQTRWVLFGTLFGVTSFLLIIFVGSITEIGDDSWSRGQILSLVLMSAAMSAIPISIGIAMLRSRLWDIDVVIRRTTSYAILTGILLLVYLGSIIVLQQLLSPVTGDSDAAIVLSTLLIAALFLPLRRRVQSVIDRRFFRSKYDAEQVLASFAATVRDETDLDELTAELVRVIQETMQPEFVNVWLKPVSLASMSNEVEA